MPTSMDQESAVGSVASRHSSVQGPYRQAINEVRTASFPFCNHVKSPEGHGRSYSRTLLLAGRGFPPKNPMGDAGNRPKVHIDSGLCIGDVIVVKSVASFKYFFNIFKPNDDPAQSAMLPPSFEPFETALQDLELKTESLPSGTVISSPGVKTSVVTTSPLELNITTSSREAAFMVFPTGASSEDLANPSVLHSYIRKHAKEWYRHIRIEEQYEIANGSLYLITGCDRPNTDFCTWANIPARYDKDHLPSPNVDIRYKYDPTNFSISGDDRDSIEIFHYPEDSRTPVFIRGMRIALSAVAWPQVDDPFDSSREYYRCLSTPTVGRYAKVLQLRDQYLRVPKNEEIEGILGEFHPANVLLPVLLQMKPTAQLAIVHDSCWIPAAIGKSATAKDLTEMILEVFSRHKIVVHDDTVLLVPKTAEDIQETPNSTGSSCLPLGKREDDATKLRDIVKELLRNHT